MLHNLKYIITNPYNYERLNIIIPSLNEDFEVESD